MSVVEAATSIVPPGVQRASIPAREEPLLRIRDLRVWFPINGGVLRRRVGWVHAVDGVSLDVPRGATLGLVGESGSGKTTIGRATVRVNRPQAGSIHLGGQDLLSLRGTELRRARRRFQMVFQDPYSSLDPRHTVGDIVGEPLRIHGLPAAGSRRARVNELLELVGLDPAFVNRYPHEFSGGQRQRIGIARALAVEPELIVCDEPVSALDVSIQAQVINLLERLQHEFDLTYLFIAHDLALVRHIADRVAVMYLGRVVETAPVDALFGEPRHPYTVALLSAVPVPDADQEHRRRRIILKGDIPNPASPPPGCRFHTRCWLYEHLERPERCRTDDPAMAAAGAVSEHLAACHFSAEVPAALIRVTATGEASGARVDALAIAEAAAAAASGTAEPGTPAGPEAGSAASLPLPSGSVPGQAFAGPGLDVPALIPMDEPGAGVDAPVSDAVAAEPEDAGPGR
jgi:oligopeptide/dipeptide ABC transporter ATP-binding protein